MIMEYVLNLKAVTVDAHTVSTRKSVMLKIIQRNLIGLYEKREQPTNDEATQRTNCAEVATP